VFDKGQLQRQHHTKSLSFETFLTEGEQKKLNG
jgi:hypothetical protein